MVPVGEMGEVRYVSVPLEIWRDGGGEEVGDSGGAKQDVRCA